MGLERENKNEVISGLEKRNFKDLSKNGFLEILTKKKLGFLIIQNKNKKTIGIITDGQIRRFKSKKNNFHSLKVKNVMTKNPISVDKDMLAAKALALMNHKKITSLSVFNKKNKSKTIGVIHIHNILASNIV